MHPWLSAPRCFVAETPLRPGVLLLSKPEGRHLSRVRRIGIDSKVSVLNGCGEVGLAKVVSVDRDRVEVEISERLSLPEPQPRLTLLIGALKQSAWDELLKHAVELGVNRIVRIQSDHAVSEVSGDKLEKKAQRWGECMTEACKQSGNPWWPSLEFAESVEQAGESVKGGSCQFFAGLKQGAKPLSAYLTGEREDEICLWVGPEGDFSDQEYSIIEAGGAQQISLGPRILRAETAALALLARLRL
ncbi:RsmE family RNA methyltransferase [Kiritimatiellaeota bacterium B1221]|nr:RsmE family RNA methyltransferase [Kiritimatiellaeota bacterium B1221]